MTFSINASTRGHPYKLYKPFSKCRARTSFSIRAVDVWNDLPANIVDFRSLQSFKKIISRLLWTCPNTSVTHIHNLFSDFCLLICLYYSCMSYYYLIRLSSFIF